MSRQQSIQQQKVRKCAVCFDAGKPESEYSSHWVKDNMGIVCCPTLMRQPCRYCDKVGHTVKFCQELIKETEKNQKMERKRKAAEAFTTSTKATEKANTKKANKWAAFEDDSDADEEEEDVVTTTTTTKSWASIVATTTLQKSAAISTANPFSKFVNSDNRPKVFASSLSWADVVDSDDEEECYV